MTGRQKNPTPPPVLNGAEREDEIVIDGADGATIEDPIIAAAEEEPAAPASDTTHPAADDLAAQLEEARRDAEKLRSENAKLASERADGQKTIKRSEALVIDNAIAATSAEKESILRRMREAKEAGDYDAEAKAIDDLQLANIKLTNLNHGKNELERQNDQPSPEDAIERYVQGMPPRSANWIRAHQEYVLDPDKFSDLNAAHFSALGKKLVPNSAPYIEHIERELGLRDDAPVAQQEQRQMPERRTPTPPPAPVSRSSSMETSEALPSGISRTADGKYRLSPAAREAARISGMSDKEYLDNALAIEREKRSSLH